MNIVIVPPPYLELVWNCTRPFDEFSVVEGGNPVAI